MSKYVKRVVAKGHVYFYFRPPVKMARKGAKPVRLGDDEKTSRQRAAQLIREWRKRSEAARERRYARNLSGCLKNALQAALKRARARGLEVDIDGQYIVQLLREQNGRCALTGIRFDLKSQGGRTFHEPYRPSIDRIDSRSGYVKGNCRLVCVAVNAALGAWGDEVFLTVARAAVKHSRGTKHRRKWKTTLENFSDPVRVSSVTH